MIRDAKAYNDTFSKAQTDGTASFFIRKGNYRERSNQTMTQSLKENFHQFFYYCSAQTEKVLYDLDTYTRKNGQVIISLMLVALASYGFEMFNFIFTIDEELYAVWLAGPGLLWLGEGRWGMFILQKFLLPYVIVPTIPLLVALVFQIGGILLILNSWQVKSKLEQVVAGSIMLTFPVLAYTYAFSTINYAIGIGFFCVAFSLFVYTRNDGPFRLLAVIPAVFALGIYQAFFLVMAATYSVYLILEIQKGYRLLRNVLVVVSIHFMSFAIYYFIQKVWQSLANIEENTYITSKYMDFAALSDNTRGVLSAFRSSVLGYYLGDIRIYGIEIKALGVIIVISLVGLIIKLAHERFSNSAKALVLFGTLALLGLPFPFVLLSRGVAESRTLLALPTAVAGLILLGLLREPKVIRALMIAVALFTIFKFSVSDNRLFSSSYLALQADRLTAVRIMEAIDNAKLEAGVLKPEYLEAVGILTRPPTDAIFRKTYPFGDSFFEFTFDVSRIAAFLQISGYDTLKALPWTERYKLVNIAAMMPTWPAHGSVRIVNGNVVMVKFGEYSDEQRNQICSALPDSAKSSMMATGFCP